MRDKLEQLTALLNRRGFHASLVESGERAAEITMELIPETASVGFGGSVTLQQLGIYEALEQRGNDVHWHWRAEKPARAKREAAFADWYLSSSNAVTEDGRFMNMDGSGNRVAAISSGTPNLLLIVGRNKLAANAHEGMRRIKEVACPLNGRRLGYNTPCAATGKCTDCSSRQRMCNVYGVLQRPTTGRQVYVLLVDEDLGF